MIQDNEWYSKFIVMSNDLKENLSKLSECELDAISARIANCIRDTETKIRAEFEKDQSK